MRIRAQDRQGNSKMNRGNYKTRNLLVSRLQLTLYRQVHNEYLTCIQEVSGSSLCLETGYPAMSHVFRHCLQPNSGIVP
jgi:hypothetical protein